MCYAGNAQIHTLERARPVVSSLHHKKPLEAKVHHAAAVHELESVFGQSAMVLLAGCGLSRRGL